MFDSGRSIGLQWSSHEDLIELVTSARRPTSIDAKLDAIIVPASRPDRNLMTAIDLARAANCHLVVLCSMDTWPERVRSLFAGRNFTKGTAIDVPRGYEYPSLRLETTEWVRGPGENVCGGRDSDLSLKRNIGLMIAWMLGWRHIFFMDDDIRGISLDDLISTVSALKTGGAGYRSSGMHVEFLHASQRRAEHFRSSSMRVKHFPDNSVVCHARRQVGEDQDVFVSGSVLAVDCTAPFDFFPDIYNEDWLFFYRNVAARELASPGLQATQMEQMKYNPFADPQRAAREEFGDVIAEGLYSLLHYRDYGAHSPTNEYWERFLLDRNVILERITDQIGNAPPELRGQIDKAILTARETLKAITSDMCVDYVAAWQRDLARWEEQLANLPQPTSVESALRTLGFSLSANSLLELRTPRT